MCASPSGRETRCLWGAYIDFYVRDPVGCVATSRAQGLTATGKSRG
jgi:hypothetical protein